MGRARRDSRLKLGTGSNIHKFFRKQFDFDVEKEWAKLKSVGRVPKEDLRDRFKLNEHINRAGERAVRARAIAGKVAVALSQYRIEYAREMRELKRQAIRQIDEWMKLHNMRRKQITNDMVEEEIASNKKMSGLYARLVEKMEELKALRATLDEFAKQWSERKGTLQTQARLVSAERELKINAKGGRDG